MWLMSRLSRISFFLLGFFKAFFFRLLFALVDGEWC